MKEHSRPEIIVNPQINFHDLTRLEITPLAFYPDGSRAGFWARDIVIRTNGDYSHRIHLFAPAPEALTLPHEVTPPEQTHGD